ncbi:hypothetical protein Bca52824_082692 [Brassica carinata]|uniref:Uncharacterized protein n=1 Tax=Brassica carinata TaxID=52824 RepID=A0A8X7TT54_BRACI|nr:hypothetical protein Bca52824_082692 [Brassica carinata]
MTSVTVVVATPVKTDLRSDGGGDERLGMGEMAMVVMATSDGGGDVGRYRPLFSLPSTNSIFSLSRFSDS